ncbi:probable jasmonic acid carboxyl methyltransferase 2 [Prosopis cineraria]|uniref:probable jasmonic acid carboxyl methyltransferase 2 n=1 Tax=Prosopis cineraria TaxID=364024 RepID=UPI00240F407F|nr:probable jasmonic acid carboxyl methyltransferase 2 [Prosopis cineraria]
MQVEQVLHMNKGAGDTSYAMNSAVQNTIISVSMAATKEAIVETVCSNWTDNMGIADLGCSSGPNALMVISDILDTVCATTRQLGRPSLELKVYLNDLYTNDFNNIFASLPSFYRKLRREKGSELGRCFIFGVPGSFYCPLFPSNSLHFVHSSSSLHWLSQVPAGLDGGGLVNKGKIYISESSPRSVVEAYSRQFQNDFTVFLKSRSREMVRGGRMVLSLIGRDSIDPTTPHSCYQWELLAQALMSLVSQGLIEEEKVDSFDAPYYAPCMQELKLAVLKEGSFMVEKEKACEIDWDGGDQAVEAAGHWEALGTMTRGERVARTVRAVVESMLESQFGSHVMDKLFQVYTELVDHYLSRTSAKYTNLVVSLVKRS